MLKFMEKIEVHKIVTILISIPLILITVFVGYQGYKSFEKIQDIKKIDSEVKLIRKINKLIQLLAIERGLSSIYISSKGQYNFHINKEKVSIITFLTKHKEKVDKYIKENFKDNEIIFNKNDLIQRIVKIRENVINSVTASVTASKSLDTKKYLQLFNEYSSLIQDLISKEEALIQNEKIGIAKDKTLQALILVKESNQLGIIRGIGSYFLTKNEILPENLYKEFFIKKLIGTEFINNMALFKNPKINQIIMKIQKEKIAENMSNLLFNMQMVLQLAYDDPETFYGYPVSTKEYFKTFSDYISKLIEITNLLLKDKEKSVLNILSKSEKDLLLFVVSFSILLLIITFLTLLFSKVRLYLRELDNLITTLKDNLEKYNSNNNDNKSDLVIDEVKIETLEGIKEALSVIRKSIIETEKQRKKAEEAVKAKSLFLANMSHEIRTPLNGILGFLELLQTTDIDETQKEYINTISNSAKNLLQIVNNILDISKIESNKVILEETEFKLIDEIEQALEIFASPASQKNIQYNIYIEPSLPSVVKGDVLKIKEIFTNLVNNAIKFTPNNGVITVRVKSKGMKEGKLNLYCEVEDSGIGMTESQRKKVFEAFSQADVSTSRKYGGTGLGLTIVKSYIEMMGGKIEVESELNKGTKFYFNVLLEVLKTQPKYLKGELKDKNVAVVSVNSVNINDNKLINRYKITNEYLEYFGCDIYYVIDAEELIQIMKREKLDTVFIFYEELNKGTIKSLSQVKIPKTFISSYLFKDEIEEFSNSVSIYDPVLPFKLLNAFETIDKLNSGEKRSESTKSKKSQVVEKGKYNLHVLIAEDNPINQKLLQTTLKQLGITSDIANNGGEAFNMYEINHDKYDIIFMDVQMPVMDGTEATKEILEYEETNNLPHTAIIAVTANALKGDRERFLGVGMDDYISKPIVRTELIQVIEKAIDEKYNNVIKTSSNNNKETKENKEHKILNKYDLVLVIDKYEKEIEILKEYNKNTKQILSKKQLFNAIEANSDNKILIIINSDILKEYEKLIKITLETFKDKKIDFLILGKRKLDDIDKEKLHIVAHYTTFQELINL